MQGDSERVTWRLRSMCNTSSTVSKHTRRCSAEALTDRAVVHVVGGRVGRLDARHLVATAWRTERAGSGA
jgi:hypothetical protein